MLVLCTIAHVVPKDFFVYDCLKMVSLLRGFLPSVPGYFLCQLFPFPDLELLHLQKELSREE